MHPYHGQQIQKGAGEKNENSARATINYRCTELAPSQNEITTHERVSESERASTIGCTKERSRNNKFAESGETTK
jgi:hypothetical protein